MLLVRGSVEVSSTAESPRGGGGGEENQPPLAVAARAHEHLEVQLERPGARRLSK